MRFFYGHEIVKYRSIGVGNYLKIIHTHCLKVELGNIQASAHLVEKELYKGREWMFLHTDYDH